MKVTTIRHGQTDWNITRRIQGWTNIELNQYGLNQAEQLAERLAVEPCDIIYTSDLLRAKKTAEIINSRHNVKLVATPILRETGFGVFEGRVIDEVRSEFGKYIDENVDKYFTTVHAYLDEILSKEHENIFIVGHFGTIRAIICYLLQLTAAQRELYTIGNTALHTFEKIAYNEFIMILENDTTHLS